MSKLCMSFSVNLSPGDKFEFHTLRVETILLCLRCLTNIERVGKG